MVAIQKNNALLASIDLFSTSPDKQQELVKKLSNYVQSVVSALPTNYLEAPTRALQHLESVLDPALRIMD